MLQVCGEMNADEAVDNKKVVARAIVSSPPPPCARTYDVIRVSTGLAKPSPITASSPRQGPRHRHRVLSELGSCMYFVLVVYYSTILYIEVLGWRPFMLWWHSSNIHTERLGHCI